FAPDDLRHPIFRPFGALAADLGQVRFRRTTRIDEGTWRVVARFSDGAAALGERQVGAGRAVLFASDLDNRWNDFPLHPAFVPFVHETVQYLSRGREQPASYAIGDAPPGVPRRPGVVTVGEPPRRVALNVDTRESDAATISREEFAANITRLHRAAAVEARGQARHREAEQSYWRYGLLLMLVALMGEGAVAARAA
ncbi:MAG: hypothetical protein LC804_12645, partial [Acidobacteria bacterium]|nr:hypothetical protein [Acidobacteriota bacterium]